MAPTFKYILPFGCIALLTACNTVPSAMPTGYTYHQDTHVFKSATPPPSKRVTPAARATMGPEQAQQFRDALYDLADRLTERAGLPPKAAEVIPHEPMNAFYAQVDNDLREAMRHLGYRLAEPGEDAYFFTYSADLIDRSSLGLIGSEHIDALGEKNVVLGLKVYAGKDGRRGRLLTEQRGQYYIEGAEAYFGADIISLPSFLPDGARMD